MLPSALHLRSISTPLQWYVLAVVLSAGALGLMALLMPLLEPGIFLLFLAAVAISALYGGLGPGLVATVISALAADYFFLPPLNTLLGETEAALRVGIFMLVGLIISWLAEGHKRAEEQLRERNEDLER